MCCNRDPKRVGVNEYYGPGDVGENKPPIKEQKRHSKKRTDDHTVFKVIPSEKKPSAHQSGINPQNTARCNGPHCRAEDGRNSLIAHLDADKIPSPEQAEKRHKRYRC
jgi:hypothetical protein